MPTLNPIAHEASFRKAVEETRASDLDVEWIVIDSESSADKINFHREGADIFIPIRRKEFNHGETRNAAAKQATGDFYIFITQDAELNGVNSIKALLKPHLENKKISVTFGRQLANKSANPIEKFVRNFNYPATSQIKEFSPHATLKTYFSSNVFSCYRKETFWEVGGFPKIILNEDMLINYKLLSKGYLCQYVPEATVTHSHNYSLGDQFSRYFDIGVSLRDNWEVFKNISSAGDGKKLAWDLQKDLLKSGKFMYAMKAPLDVLCRFAGFHIGLRHHMIPKWIKPRLSMQAYYWNS